MMETIQNWKILAYDIHIPISKTMRKKRFGTPIKITIGNNGFIPNCIYQNNKGDKIVYVFEKCDFNSLINKYAIYSLK